MTISEIFPLEVRALALAFFYCIGTAIGGISGPFLYGYLMDSGERIELFYGYLVAIVLMLIGAVVAAVFGVNAEQKSLEDITDPLNKSKHFNSELIIKT